MNSNTQYVSSLRGFDQLDAFMNERLTTTATAPTTTSKPSMAMPMPMLAPQPSQPKSTDKTKTLLPFDFEPTEHSVICGNKRQFFNSPGNKKFRAVCKLFVPAFKQATNKQEKSNVVSKVMDKLRAACPVGTFVAFEKGCWWEVSERTAREKVGTYFRDCLGDAYKSSAKNKIAQRKYKRSSSQNSNKATSMENRSNSSSPFCGHFVADQVFSTVPASAPIPAVSPAPAAHFEPKYLFSQPPTSSQPQPQQPQLDSSFHSIFKVLDLDDLKLLTQVDDDEEDASSWTSGSFYDVDDLTPVKI
jgi:hypothetical protein